MPFNCVIHENYSQVDVDVVVIVIVVAVFITEETKTKSLLSVLELLNSCSFWANVNPFVYAFLIAWMSMKNIAASVGIFSFTFFVYFIILEYFVLMCVFTLVKNTQKKILKFLNSQRCESDFFLFYVMTFACDYTCVFWFRFYFFLLMLLLLLLLLAL